MRKILLLMTACCGFALAAQQVTVKAHYQLLKGVESGIYHPVLSSDGSKLLFSGSNEKGLKLYDIADNVVTTITDAERAGFEPKVTLRVAITSEVKRIDTRSRSESEPE